MRVAGSTKPMERQKEQLYERLNTPSEGLVREHCEVFDRDKWTSLTEKSAAQLFSLYPLNICLSDVLIKVAVLNALYSTRILAIESVARHIFNTPNLDARLAGGDVGVVNEIALVELESGPRNNISFASKYCSWHKPDIYPIYDLNVDEYLWVCQKRDQFSSFKRYELRDYPRFFKVMGEFRSFYKLGSFSFKEIDKFLWTEGGELLRNEWTKKSAEVPGAEAPSFPGGDSRA